MLHSHVKQLIPAPINHKKLRKFVQRLAVRPLFEIGKNAKYNFSQLMQLPVAAALENRSIENQSLLTGRVSADNFYHHFKNKLKLTSLQTLFCRHIQQVKKVLKNGNLLHERFIIAIDKTEELYWGEIDNPFVTGGKREASTNYAFRYLTVTSVLRGQRFFLYIRPLTVKDDNDALLVEECLEELRKLGFQIGTLLGDREFYNGKIVLICNIQKIEYVIPAVKNERFQSKVEELRREGKKFPRIIENYEIADEVTNLILYEEKNSKGEIEVFGFITNITADEISDDVNAIIELYRMRWGIENAHKYEDGFRIPTNSTDGVIRFFFFMLGVILHNLWVLLNMLAASFGAVAISLNVMKDILKIMHGLAALQSYKHPQRELWVEILLGKNTTVKCCTMLSHLYSFFKDHYVGMLNFTLIYWISTVS
jgi:hypothetical protein